MWTLGSMTSTFWLQLDHAGGHDALALVADGDRLGLAAVELEGHFLEVQQDVGDVLPDARQGGEFVLDALDADVGHGGTLDAAEQDPAEGMPARSWRSHARTGRRRTRRRTPSWSPHVTSAKRGRWKSLMFSIPVPLLAVEFDDQLLVDVQRHVFPGGSGDDLALEGGAVEGEPFGNAATGGGFHGGLHEIVALGLLGQLQCSGRTGSGSWGCPPACR